MGDFRINLAEYRSLFVVKPSSLGDIVHTLPVIELIHQHAPHLMIRWICNPEWKPLLADYPAIHEIIEFPRKSFRGLKIFGAAIRFSKYLRSLPKEEPELTIDFQGLLRSAMICKARKSDTIIGFSDSREGSGLAHQHVVEVSSSMHAVDRYLSVLPHLGIGLPSSPLHFPLCSRADVSRFHLPGSYVLLHPYSRGEGKSMDIASVQAFIDHIAPHPVLLVGVNKEHAPIHNPRVLDLVNHTSLSELIVLSQKAKACISVDSGPMHIAAAVNPHTLGIYTWSQPSRVGPYSDQAKVWKAGRIASRKELTADEDRTIQKFQTKDTELVASFVTDRWLSR